MGPRCRRSQSGWEARAGLGPSCSGLGWSLPAVQREPQGLVCKTGLPVHPIGEHHGQGPFLCPPPKQSTNAEYFGSKRFLHTSGLFLVLALEEAPGAPNTGYRTEVACPLDRPPACLGDAPELGASLIPAGPASTQHSGPVPRDFPSVGPWLEARGSVARALVLLTSARASHGAPQGPPGATGPTKWAVGGWQW